MASLAYIAHGRHILLGALGFLIVVDSITLELVTILEPFDDEFTSLSPAPWMLYLHQEPECPHEVVAAVMHQEPAAQLDTEFASLQADIEWAEHVQDRIRANLPLRVADNVAVMGKVFLLRFGSAPSGGYGPQQFRQELITGPALRPCREALTAAGYPFVHLNGAVMLVMPEQHAQASQALVGIELHPFHVIISETFEYLIEEVLSGFCFSASPQVEARITAPHGAGISDLLPAQSAFAGGPHGLSWEQAGGSVQEVHVSVCRPDEPRS